MCQTIEIAVAPGELIDKLTILDIKLDRIRGEGKRRNVAIERDDLLRAVGRLDASEQLSDLTSRLRLVNEALWTIEDDIRDCERSGDFGPAFVALARAVYRTNDQRAEIKRQINLALGSRLIEEKSYTPYA